VDRSFSAAQQPPPGHLTASAAQHPRRWRGRHRGERLRRRELRGGQGHGDGGLELGGPGVAEQLHQARAGVGARGDDAVGVSARVWARHREGDDGAGHGVRVLRIVEVRAAVEGRRHRRKGVGTGRRRWARGATGGAGEDGCGSGGGHGVRWRPEEVPELEGRVGIRVSGGRRHGRRLGRVKRWQWSRSGRGGTGGASVEGRGGRVASHFTRFSLEVSLYCIRFTVDSCDIGESLFFTRIHLNPIIVLGVLVIVINVPL
jgi:hypothetical protein